MARPLRILFPDAYYHVTCRGNGRKPIFRDDTDRSVFIGKLRASREIYHVEIHAYVLMPNHFHLILKTPKANLSEFMRHFNISYTAAFNRRLNRVGHLYQGRYKAILEDSYLLELSRYVHVNPVRIRSHRAQDIREQIKFLDSFPWSSVRGYLYSANKLPWTMTPYWGMSVEAGSGTGSFWRKEFARVTIRHGKGFTGKSFWGKRISSSR
jgi:REP element-mobilizing transposase RayT